MLGHKSTILVSLMGASLATAQSVIDHIPVSLTSSCSATLQGLLAAPEAGCLNLPALSTFIVNPDKSVPQTVNTWLTGLCDVESCTNQDIATVVANITQGCSEDFSQVNVDSMGLQSTITNIAQQTYPTIRKVACLKDTTKDELCVTQTLNNLEKTVGKLSLTDLNIDTLNQDAEVLFSSNLTELACTSCMKTAYTMGVKDFPAQVSQANSPLELFCGPSFLDLNTSSDVVTTAVAEQLHARRASINSGFILNPFARPAGWGLLALSTASVFMT